MEGTMDLADVAPVPSLFCRLLLSLLDFQLLTKFLLLQFSRMFCTHMV